MIVLFCQLLKWLARNFSTWNAPWRVLPIYSSQNSAPSCLASHIPTYNWGRPRLPAVSSPYEISWGIFFHSSDKSQPEQSGLMKHIVNIVGCPHLDSTTVFGVLLIQDVQRSFFSGRIWKTFNLRSWAASVVQDSLLCKSVLRTQVLSVTPWSW